jgi:hypothetical protein
MLDGDYSSSESDDEHSSAASDVDLEQVVEAISDLVGAGYSAKGVCQPQKEAPVARM